MTGVSLALRRIATQQDLYTPLYYPDGRQTSRYDLHRDPEVYRPFTVEQAIDPNCDPAAEMRAFYRRIDLVIRRRNLTTTPPPCPRRRRSRRHCYVNVYLEDRAFGGVEEGGWWYDCGGVVESIKVSRKRADQELRYWQAWVAEENANRRSDISSVLSEGRFVVEVEDFPGQGWPSGRPHYE